MPGPLIAVGGAAARVAGRAAVARALQGGGRKRRGNPLGWILGALAAGSAIVLLLPLIVITAIAGGCPTSDAGGQVGISAQGAGQIPANLPPIYMAAAQRYGLGPDGWTYLAGINKVETDFGRNLSNSGVGANGGAKGWMQFEDATFASFGVDAPLDGMHDAPNVRDAADAIFSAANYLHASGAPGNWSGAILTYNHSQAYVDQVTALAHGYAGTVTPSLTAPSASGQALSVPPGASIRTGKASTYGWDPVTGFVDHADNNRPALAGATNDTPGIAVYDPATLGGWFLVKDPNGTSAVLQQTDIGPDPSVHRLVDINAVAARTVFHLGQGNAFPTDAGNWTLVYLGKNRPADAAAIAANGVASNTTDCSGGGVASGAALTGGGHVFPMPAGAAGPPGTWTNDQGVDITGAGHTPLLAVAAGTIVAHGITGFGDDAPVLKLDQPIGSFAAIYYGHAGPGGAVPIGTHVQAGQVIGEVGAGIVGISTGPHLEIGFSSVTGNPVGPSTAPAMHQLLLAAYGQGTAHP